MSPALARAALGALLLAAAPGCADHGFCRAETVTETRAGLWMAGAHGVAAFLRRAHLRAA